MFKKKCSRCFSALLVLAGIALAPAAQAQEEIVIGGSIPMTGVFGFAGISTGAGISDYVKMINESGGIKGRKVRYVFEDTAYKPDVSVGVFKKLTGSNNINLYYGDSTAFNRTINPELERMGSILMSGTSMATELNDPKKYPLQFIAGPDYSDQIGILLRYIAKEKPGAKVALVYSDTEFGRDPINEFRDRSKKLGLAVAAEIMTAPGSVDVSTDIIKLRRADPDYTIFHGYVLAPIPEFMSQMKKAGAKSHFMGSTWATESSLVMKMGEAGDGYMGVMPYRYYYDTSASAPMLEKILQMRPEYQTTMYLQGFLTAMLLVESAKRTLDAGKPLDAKNMKAALNSIKNFDTGGLIGIPITIKGNSVPVGRIYKADMKAQRMVPVSDWMTLD